MPKGSGIATYARNLNAALAALGHETQILFSSTRDQDPNNLMNEVAIVDVPPLEQKLTPLKRLGRHRPAFRPTAWPVTPTGDVDMREVANRFPACDRVWASRDIFHASNRAHSALGRFTPVRLGGETQTDLMHWTCALPMYEPRMSNLYTLHDLVPLRLPFTTLDNKRNFHAMAREIVERAERVVTVSEHSRADIIRILGAPEDKVINTYQAVDVPERYRSLPDEEVANEIESMFDLGWRDYFLFYGAIEPKKNLARIVEAYLTSGSRRPLVIVGGRSWLDEDQMQLVYEDIVQTSLLREGVLRRADRVRQYDYLPFRLLVSLIRGARATLFPSLYEGFGLPVLESMLLGTPVLTSTEGSLPEVAGEAALMVDPYDVNAIRAAIRALDADTDLRQSLTTLGRAQAEKFSPARYRERLADLYRPLI